MWQWVKVAHSCPTLCDPVDCTVHGILQGRTLEWVAFPSSRGSFQPRDRTQVSCIAGGFFTCWAISSGQFSCSAVSNSLRPHGLQHAKSHQLLQFNQTHGHWVCDATQPSHPLSSSSPPGFSLSQHQGLFNWVSSSHQVAKGLEFPLHHQSFQWILRTDFLEDGLFGTPCSPRDSQESSSTPQFKSINSSVLSFLYSQYMTTGKKHSFG